MFPGELIKNPDMLVNMDPPEQTRLRRLASGAFSPSRVAKLEEWIQSVVDQLWDDMEAAGPGADFMVHFAPRLPFFVMSGILGIHDDEAEHFAKMIDIVVGMDVTREARAEAHHDVQEFLLRMIAERRAHESDDLLSVLVHARDDDDRLSEAEHFAKMIDTVVGMDVTREARAEAHHDVQEFLLRMIAERRAHESDDLLSVLVHARDDDDRLSEAELQGLALALWLGGLDTTHHEVGSMVYALMTHPAQWQELRDDPSVLASGLEELWRWIPSHKYGVFFPRWASEDLELPSGTLIKAGEPVYPEHTVANRDESVFPDAGELDFHRVDPQPHLTFAFGAHHCMGSHLARLEIRLAITTMLRRFPTLELACAPDEVEWDQSSMLRGLKTMPLTW
jgi:cytochrome P450